MADCRKPFAGCVATRNSFFVESKVCFFERGPSAGKSPTLTAALAMKNDDFGYYWLTLRIQARPKEGIYTLNPILGMGCFDHQSGFLGLTIDSKCHFMQLKKLNITWSLKGTRIPARPRFLPVLNVLLKTARVCTFSTLFARIRSWCIIWTRSTPTLSVRISAFQLCIQLFQLLLVFT